MSRIQSVPLYECLGGQSGIERIVDGMLLAISEDERIAHHFAESNILRLRAKLIEQLCAEPGGPCTYTGDSMRANHAGHGYRDADLSAVVEALQRAMREQGIAGGDQNRLLVRLAPLRREIVEDWPRPSVVPRRRPVRALRHWSLSPRIARRGAAP